MEEKFDHEIESFLKEIEYLRGRDKILLAFKKWEELERKLTDGKKEDLLKTLSENPSIQTLKKEASEVNKLMSEFDSNEGWTLVNDKDGVRSYYRHETSSPMHSMKIEGIIPAPLFNVLAIIYEVDLYITWWPLLREVKQVKEISKFRKVVYMRAELPWPMWHRDVLFYGYGVDNLDIDQSAVIMVRSVNEEESKVFPIPVPNHHVRMDCKFGGMLARPISPTETKVTLLSNLNPHLAIVPYALLNMITRQFSYLLLNTLKQLATNIKGTEYEKRIQMNKDIYDDAKQRIEEFFEKKKQENNNNNNNENITVNSNTNNNNNNLNVDINSNTANNSTTGINDNEDYESIVTNNNNNNLNEENKVNEKTTQNNNENNNNSILVSEPTN